MLSKLIERIDIWESDIKIKFRISMEEFVGTGDSRISTALSTSGSVLIRGKNKVICQELMVRINARKISWLRHEFDIVAL